MTTVYSVEAHNCLRQRDAVSTQRHQSNPKLAQQQAYLLLLLQEIPFQFLRCAVLRLSEEAHFTSLIRTEQHLLSHTRRFSEIQRHTHGWY